MWISVEEMKAYLGSSRNTSDDLIEQAVLEAQGYIEDRCKRSFESSTGTKYYREDNLITLPVGSQYRPPGGAYQGYSWDVNWQYQGYGGATYPRGLAGVTYGHRVLWLADDLLSISALTNGDGNVISSTGYWLEPRNKAPYQWIRLKSSETWQFDTDGEIEVAGTWGYSTAPSAILKGACKQLAAYYYRLKDSQVFDVTASPETGTITIPKGVPASVEKILKDNGYIKAVRFA